MGSNREWCKRKGTRNGADGRMGGGRRIAWDGEGPGARPRKGPGAPAGRRNGWT